LSGVGKSEEGIIMRMGVVLAVILLSGIVAWGEALPEDWRAQGVLLSEERIALLRERVAAQAEPTWSAWQELRAKAEVAKEREAQAPSHWMVPRYYEDGEGHRNAKIVLQEDGDAAYALALVWKMTGEEVWAEAAVRFLNAWATEVQTLDEENDSALSFSYHFPALLAAAGLVKDSGVWPEEEQADFRRFVREKALPLNTMQRANNWANWGVVLVLAAGAWLDDREIFEDGLERWRELVESQIAEDGHLPHEVTRAGHGRPGDYGIWYSHFTLMPASIGAEIARVNGVDLYHHESPSGRTLRMAYEWLVPYVREPARFPYFEGGDPAQLLGVNYISYFELLHPQWPHPDAASLLEEHRPLTANHAAPYLTFTHGEPLESE